MNCTTLDLVLDRAGETVYLTPLFDAHTDSPDADLNKLRRVLDERSRLGKHVILSGGDLFNAILPGDVKRYRPTENHPEVSARDDMIDEIVRRQHKLLGKHPFILLGQGNHEQSTLNHHLTDLTARLADTMKLPSWVHNGDDNGVMPCGGYSGFLRLRFWDKSRWKNNRTSGPRASIDIAYHHGKWCGQNKGIIGADRWAKTMNGARLFLYGHNHQCLATPFVSNRMSASGNLHEETSYLVACGTFMRSSVSGRTTYSEIGAHPPAYVGSPLIRLSAKEVDVKGRPRVPTVDVSVTIGD